MFIYHKYIKGDDIFMLAVIYRVPPCVIMSVNNIKNTNDLQEGMFLKIPAWWFVTDSGFSCAENASCIMPEIGQIPEKAEKADKPDKADYVVKEGDTLFKIAKEYSTTMRSIMRANALSSTSVNPGDNLTIPLPPDNSVVYIVKPKQTLDQIASEFNVSVEDITARNDIDPTAQLYPGMQLLVSNQ